MAGVTERTVRNWRRKAGGRVGRPPVPAAVRWQVRGIVLRIWRKLPERTGARTVLDVVDWMLPTRLVRESLRGIKAVHGARRARGRARRRISLRATAAQVVWHLDATHLGRTEEGREVQAQAIRDAARPGVLAASVGRPATTADALRALATAIEAAGGARPLVLSTDDGGAYRSRTFRAALRALRIVHLRNLPHTPEHNARIERVFRDWKSDEDLGRGVVLPSVEAAAERVRRACAAQECLAAARGRPLPLTVEYTETRRASFYRSVCRRIRGAVQRERTARARRLAEREAIHAELEDRGLIVRTRGGAPLAARETETIT